MLEYFDNRKYLLTAIISTNVLAVIYVIKYVIYKHLKSHGVAHETPSLFLGNLPFSYFFGGISVGNIFRESYMKFRQHAFYGYYVFFRPVIVINDPELIKSVIVKDFSHFTDRGWFSNEKNDRLSGHIFLSTGEKWKHIRKSLSPTFTTAKLKQIYNIFMDISNEMINVCDKNLEKTNVFDVKDMLARFTSDAMTTIVYGFNCNSLNDPDSEFRVHGKQALEFGKARTVLGAFIPGILKATVNNLNRKSVQKFFLNIFDNTLNYRREKKIDQKDLFDLLLQLADHSADKDDNKFSMDEVAAQAFFLFVGGFEMASSSASYCLYELALNPEIQDELHKQIDELAESSEGFTYDNIMKLEYLDMVIYETLRKHPAVPILNRICEQDYRIPDSKYTIRKGTRIVISISGIQSNPEYYPDPDKFDPERFSKENSASRNHYTYLAFSDGPRSCIGKRFGMMQIKLCLATMLRNYKFSICEKTLIPVQYSPHTFVQSPKDGIHLRVEKRK